MSGEMNNSTLINQDSGNVEYFTPLNIVEAARATMGGIDLDPASCLLANIGIMAGKIFTKEDDGLSQLWFGRVWMNHPFSKDANRLWIEKLVREYESHRVEQACCITFASTSEKWFKPLLSYPQCFLHSRTNFLNPSGTVQQGATKGCVVTYMGLRVDRFAAQFRNLGTTKLPFKFQEAA